MRTRSAVLLSGTVGLGSVAYKDDKSEDEDPSLWHD
jgi:hypothetical protein